MRIIFILILIIPLWANCATTFFQLPDGMNLSDFPIHKSHLIPKEKLSTSREYQYLSKLSKKANIDERFIRSDFDKDGIRDFTLSSNGIKIVIAAEDNDWDDDGILNLIDPFVGKFKIPNSIPLTKIRDSYDLNSNINYLDELNRFHIQVINSKDSQHEKLVLHVLLNVMKKIKSSELKLIKATSPKISYGKNVFFSYVGNANVLEFYPSKFNTYINNLKRDQYKTVSHKVFLNSIVIPIVVHSLAHELGHSLSIPRSKIREIARKSNWIIDEKTNSSIYSTKNRHPFKNIPRIIENQSFKNQSYTDFLHNYDKYLKYKKTNKLISTYLTGSNSKNKDLKYSFLKEQKIPSLYAAKNPSEWFAENYSSCIYVLFYPSSDTLDGATKTELLIGIRPDVRFIPICEQFL